MRVTRDVIVCAKHLGRNGLSGSAHSGYAEELVFSSQSGIDKSDDAGFVNIFSVSGFPKTVISGIDESTHD